MAYQTGKAMAICQQCGAEFSDYPSRLKHRQFCSISCGAKHSHLGKRNHNHGKPWGWGVSSTYKGENFIPRRIYPRNCPICLKDFLAYSPNKNAKYCSMSCSGKARRKPPVIVKCRRCRQPFTLRYPSWEGKRTLCSRECYSLWWKENYSGENHRRFRGPFVYHYGTPSWKALRKEVLSRDKNQCYFCNTTYLLRVHHIRGVRQFLIREAADTLKNLITLCLPCHTKVHEGKLVITQERRKHA